MTIRELALVPTPPELLGREDLALRLRITPRAVTRLGLPRLPGKRGGLYVWEDVVAELKRRAEAKRMRRRAS